MYLEGANQMAGLGHSFMSFNHLVTIATENDMSLRSTFKTEGHGMDSARVQKYFFGNLFMADLPKGTNPKTGCLKKMTSYDSVSRDVHGVTNAMTKSDTSRPLHDCVVFALKEPVPPSEEGLGFNRPQYRRVFEMNDHARNQMMERKWQQTEAKAVHVAVHIRRGDLTEYIKKKKGASERIKAAEQRLVANSAYTSVLNQLLPKLVALGAQKIIVQLYCEGLLAPASIPDANGKHVDFRGEIHASLRDDNLNLTFVAGETDTLEAIDSMCHSDILITGTSGFSHVVSVLCKTPVILAMPFWHSYDYIPNAITMEVERGNYSLPAMDINDPPAWLVHSAKFNETRFESLWKNRESLPSTPQHNGGSQQ